jgi:GABA(A) receptor-associated protein
MRLYLIFNFLIKNIIVYYRMDNFNFKKRYSFEDRIKESEKIKSKYSERVPVIVEASKDSKLKKIDKNKFLVPEDLTIGNFIAVIRKRIQIKPEEALFIFIDNILPCTSQTVGNVHHEHKDKDGFLYIQYTEENTFG